MSRPDYSIHPPAGQRSSRIVAATLVLGFLLPVSATLGLEVQFVGSLDNGPLAPTSLVVGETGIAALEPYSGQLELFTPKGVLTAKVKINSDARGLAQIGEHVFLYCDRDRSRVVHVDLTSGNQRDWLGETFDKTFEPVDVVVAGEECFVLDADRRRILVCDKFGSVTSVVNLVVPSGQSAGWLADLAWDSSRNIFYALEQTESRIQAYRRDGSYVGGFASFGNRDGQVTRGGEIICDYEGWIYVTDRYQGRVVVFDENWEFVGNIEPVKLGGPSLNVPTGLALDPSGFLYVASTEGSAIQVYQMGKIPSSLFELMTLPFSPTAGDSLLMGHLSFAASTKAPASLASSVVVDFRIAALSDTTQVAAEAVGLPLVDGTIMGDFVTGTVVWEPDIALKAGADFGWQARTRAGTTTGPWMALRSFVITPLPARFRLMQNFPNPFNPLTSIFFELKGGQDAELSIYDLRGRLVWNRNLSGLGAGAHKIVWDGSNNWGSRMSSGMYFYRLVEGDSHAARKMIMVK